MNSERGLWKSKLGFILAASGSAIGLGNIVFFPARAYQYGGGAFYIPYFIALLVIGIPLMILEFSFGRMTCSSYPTAMRKLGGKTWAALGWMGIVNAFIICAYYITILGWVVGMWVGTFGALWKPSAVEAFGIPSGVLSNSMSYFFNMISNWNTVVFVLLVWAINILMIMWGTRSIEKSVRFCVPLMWIFMIILIIRGVTLPGGGQGVMLLFTPDFSIMKSPDVWKGAFSQIFFTLSLGLGIMVAYGSYLPRKSDDTNNAMLVSFMNCGFEYIAGVAIFSLLFAFAIVPKASTLSMMFFIVPEGIAKFPFGAKFFGFLFFTLLFLAGITSSVSLVESFISSIIDYFNWPRKRAILFGATLGVIGSVIFGLPHVIDPNLDSDGTLGLTLLDLFDHWAFGYGLIFVGLTELLLLGWVANIDEIRNFVNAHSRYRLGKWFNYLVKFILPLVLLSILILSIIEDSKTGLYGTKMVTGKYPLGVIVFIIWLASVFIGGFLISMLKGNKTGEADKG